MNEKKIFTIERRLAFESGRIAETWYEVRRYERRSEHTGALIGGKTVRKFKSKLAAQEYCGRRGIVTESV